MEGQSFDRFARDLASGSSRRGFLRGIFRRGASAAAVSVMGTAAIGAVQPEAALATGSCPGTLECLQCGCSSGTQCGDYCVDTQTDKQNCGSCGNVCGTNEICASGACVCDTGYTDCSGTCVATSTDESNCGACGNICTGGRTCCGGVCRDLSSDVSHCGSCSHQCLAGNGEYWCCDGVCANLANNTDNCGACGNVCPELEHCYNYACVCDSGYQRCSATGECVVCAGDQIVDPVTCECHCPTGKTFCTQDQRCHNLQYGDYTPVPGSDTLNCGACGYQCPSSPYTTYCCGGQCKDIVHDRNHCGACDNACAADRRCQDYICICDPEQGYSDCSGICVQKQTDENNCGACGNVCDVGETCTAGACV